MVDVGGRLLYLACMGVGSPTVVLEGGGEGNSASWKIVQPSIAEFTRVCAYDRAGEGYSSSVSANPNIEAMVRDLRELLRAGGIEEPFVMVGHSFGGALARASASLFPDDVVGMILVDSGDDAFLNRAEEFLTPDEWGQYTEVGGGIVRRMREIQGTLKVGPLGDIPLVVLSASDYLDRPGLPNEIDVKLYEVLVTLHRELAAESAHGTHILAENSGHAIQDEQPELVINAIRQVVEAVRVRERP